ncbi:hypothetical protein ACT44I_07185 [Acinetobacter baumannii]|nr:hypothetical protein [Acinetobacter baumannii]MDC4637988.1 hypothetical protein [Acinetobacter baumannii]
MSGFEVSNDKGEIIVSDTYRHLGVNSVQVLDGGAPSSIGASSGWAPSFIQTPSLVYPSFRNDLPKETLYILNLSEGTEFCGKYWHSVHNNNISFLSYDYTKTSGYLDVYDEQGNLIWSAISAKNVPRIVQTYQLTADNLLYGITLSIGFNVGILLNTLPSWFRPGPMNNLNRGGVFGRYSNGQLQLQFAAAAKLNDISSRIIENLGPNGTLPVHITSFAS